MMILWTLVSSCPTSNNVDATRWRTRQASPPRLFVTTAAQQQTCCPLGGVWGVLVPLMPLFCYQGRPRCCSDSEGPCGRVSDTLSVPWPHPWRRPVSVLSPGDLRRRSRQSFWAPPGRQGRRCPHWSPPPSARGGTASDWRGGGVATGGRDYCAEMSNRNFQAACCRSSPNPGSRLCPLRPAEACRGRGRCAACHLQRETNTQEIKELAVGWWSLPAFH